MIMMCKCFCKKLLGEKYDRLYKDLFISLIVFFAIKNADYNIYIAPAVLYIISWSFTFGVMWQALSSDDNLRNIMNMFMLPFDKNKLILSYMVSLGAYTLFTKTIFVLSLIFAVCSFKIVIVISCILCILNAIVMATSIFAVRKRKILSIIWCIASIILIFIGKNEILFAGLQGANILISFFILSSIDAYSFYKDESSNNKIVKNSKQSVWMYFFRYLSCHKNYLFNTAALWCIACILPYFYKQMNGQEFTAIGFAVLSLNTPICILISCDRDLQQAIIMLPGQKRAIYFPYCLFIFLFNIIINTIFLISWQFQIGGITMKTIFISLYFAMQSSLCAVIMECFFPIRNWKIESDLWHHPRKYVIPLIMVVIAMLVCIYQNLIYFLMFILIIEFIYFYYECRR